MTAGIDRTNRSAIDNSSMLSVVVPDFNDEGSVSEVVRRLLEIPFNLEIIIVNDGSTDGTAAILEELARAESRIQLVH